MAAAKDSDFEGLARRLAAYYGLEVYTRPSGRIHMVYEDDGKFAGADYADYDDWSQALVVNEDRYTLNEMIGGQSRVMGMRLKALRYSSLDELELKLTAKGF